MYAIRSRKPQRRRGMRVEQLEARTLLHTSAYAFVDGVIDIDHTHGGGDTIVVQWDPATRSVGVLSNGQEYLRVAAADVRGVNLRGLTGNDVALIDTRLRLPVTYDRGGLQGMLSGQLDGSGDGDDYCVVTPNCEAFVFSLDRATSRERRRDPAPATDADATTVRAVLHAGHGGMSSGSWLGMPGDGAMLATGAMLLAGGMAATAEAGHAASVDPMNYAGAMQLMVRLGTMPKWHPTACTCFGQKMDRLRLADGETNDGNACPCQTPPPAEAAPPAAPQGSESKPEEPAAVPAPSPVEDNPSVRQSPDVRGIDALFAMLSAADLAVDADDSDVAPQPPADAAGSRTGSGFAALAFGALVLSQQRRPTGGRRRSRDPRLVGV